MQYIGVEFSFFLNLLQNEQTGIYIKKEQKKCTFMADAAIVNLIRYIRGVVYCVLACMYM